MADEAIAGHAMVIGTPIVHLIDALKLGGEEEHVHAARRAHLFRPAAATGRVPPMELSRALSGDLDDQIRALQGVCCEGTGPSNSQLWEHNPQVRAQQKVTADRLDVLLQSVSPSIGMPMRFLNTGPGGSNIFYDNFVEVLFGAEDAFDEELTKHGAGACHFALGVSQTEAGVGPTDFAKGKYVADPRWRCGERRAEIIGSASLEARTHTLPPSGPLQLTPTQNDLLSQNMQRLAELDVKMRKNAELLGGLEACSFDTGRMLIPFAAQIGNSLGMANLVELMQTHPGRVQSSPVTDLAEFGGTQMGVFTVITLLNPK